MEREKLRILIADDDAGDRRQLIRALRQASFPVEFAETASVEEALERCERETFDCAMVDYLLPGQDGLSGISLLHERCPAMPILMVTGQGDVGVATEAMKRGASDYMPKATITAESIRRAVENALEKASLQRTVVKQQEELFRLEAERHASELEIELARAAEANRINARALELRDDFLSHVSHELRAPLSSIASFSSIIEDGLAGPVTEEQKEYLAIIQKNAKQLGSMIEDLMAVRAAQMGKLRIDLQRMSLVQAIEDAVKTCGAKAKEKGVTLTAVVPAELAPAYADPVRVVQVLIILCDNAIKFTPAGGTVTVRSGACEKESGFLLVEVTDTGCGIPPELTERIFDHLYQVMDASRKGRTGLGLGLHIAKELATQQGGRIWAESEPGKGSQMRFTVPTFTGQETGLASGPEAVQAAGGITLAARQGDLREGVAEPMAAA